jgi:outer membrane protein assembly factor BamB
MIDDDGRVIANDARKIYMLAPNGSLLWEVPLPGGVPISPVRTDSGLIVLVTTEGWVVSIDPSKGALVEQMQLTGRINLKRGRFSTRNTPTVIGNRVYSLNEFAPWVGTGKP